MSEQLHKIVKRIMQRIKEEWKIHEKELLPEIDFEAYKQICLKELDLASESNLKPYQIGKYAIYEEKLNNELIEKKDQKIKRLEKEIQILKEKGIRAYNTRVAMESLK